MTTQTAAYYVEDLSTKEHEERTDFNSYVAGVINYILSHLLGTHEGLKWGFRYQDSSQAPFIRTEDISRVRQALRPIEVSENNLRAISLLEEWFAEPDDLGEDFWEEFDKELEANRFTIP